MYLWGRRATGSPPITSPIYRKKRICVVISSQEKPWRPKEKGILRLNGTAELFTKAKMRTRLTI